MTFFQRAKGAISPLDPPGSAPTHELIHKHIFMFKIGLFNN